MDSEEEEVKGEASEDESGSLKMSIVEQRSAREERAKRRFSRRDTASERGPPELLLYDVPADTRRVKDGEASTPGSIDDLSRPSTSTAPSPKEGKRIRTGRKQFTR
jgi:hypothetical protein